MFVFILKDGGKGIVWEIVSKCFRVLLNGVVSLRSSLLAFYVMRIEVREPSDCEGFD